MPPVDPWRTPLAHGEHASSPWQPQTLNEEPSRPPPWTPCPADCDSIEKPPEEVTVHPPGLSSVRQGAFPASEISGGFTIDGSFSAISQGWNSGPKRGSPKAIEQHTAGPWHIVAVPCSPFLRVRRFLDMDTVDLDLQVESIYVPGNTSLLQWMCFISGLYQGTLVSQSYGRRIIFHDDVPAHCHTAVAKKTQRRTRHFVSGPYRLGAGQQNESTGSLALGNARLPCHLRPHLCGPTSVVFGNLPVRRMSGLCASMSGFSD